MPCSPSLQPQDSLMSSSTLACSLMASKQASISGSPCAESLSSSLSWYSSAHRRHPLPLQHPPAPGWPPHLCTGTYTLSTSSNSLSRSNKTSAKPNFLCGNNTSIAVQDRNLVKEVVFQLSERRREASKCTSTFIQSQCMSAQLSVRYSQANLIKLHCPILIIYAKPAKACFRVDAHVCTTM